jgi:hypothetical protein
MRGSIAGLVGRGGQAGSDAVEGQDITAIGNGLTLTAGSLAANLGTGLTFSAGAIIPSLGNGLTTSGSSIVASLGSGLTFATGAIANDVLTGKAGSQTWSGGTAASETVTIQSTAHGTKGKIFLGGTAAKSLTVDEVNGRVGINVQSPSTALDVRNTMQVLDSGTTGYLTFAPASPTATLGEAVGAGNYRWLFGRSLLGTNVPGLGFGFDGSGNIATSGTAIGSSAARTLSFYTSNATALVERGSIDPNGNHFMGTAAIATNATDGFTSIASCAGAPTGVPTLKTGLVPLVIDSTNSKLYAYIGGAWKAVTLA